MKIHPHNSNETETLRNETESMPLSEDTKKEKSNLNRRKTIMQQIQRRKSVFGSPPPKKSGARLGNLISGLGVTSSNSLILTHSFPSIQNRWFDCWLFRQGR